MTATELYSKYAMKVRSSSSGSPGGLLLLCRGRSTFAPDQISVANAFQAEECRQERGERRRLEKVIECAVLFLQRLGRPVQDAGEGQARGIAVSALMGVP